MSGAQVLMLALAGAVTFAAVLWVLGPLRRLRLRSGAVVAAGLPVAAVGLYFALGTPRAIEVASEAPHPQAPADLQAMTQRLQARLQAQPQDLQGWFMLARSHQVLQQWDSAAAAYRRALALAPDDPGLLADLADVLAVMSDGELEGEPRALLDRGLRHDPLHAKTRLLLAAADFRQGRLAQAAAHWEVLLRARPEDTEATAIAKAGLARIEQLSGKAGERLMDTTRGASTVQ